MIQPLKFRTRFESVQAMAYVRAGKPIPDHLMIWPTVLRDGKQVPNPEYEKASFTVEPECPGKCGCGGEN